MLLSLYTQRSARHKAAGILLGKLGSGEESSALTVLLLSTHSVLEKKNKTHDLVQFLETELQY